MNHRKAIKIIEDICYIDNTGINCINCPYFGKCKLDKLYGRPTRYEMLASYTNPLNQ